MKKILFKIETNKQFKKTNIKKKNKVKLINILNNFNIKINIDNITISKISKKNLDSEIFEAFDKKNKFIILKKKKFLNYTEKLIKYLKNKKDNLTPKYAQTKKKKFIFYYENYYYLVYTKINGIIFNGNPNHIDKIYDNALILHNKIKKFKFNQLKKKRIYLDIKKIIKKIKSKKFNNLMIKKKMISKKTLQMIEKSDHIVSQNFISLYKNYKKINYKETLCHNDLNHSNIIMNSEIPNFIDIDSYVFSDIRISLAHLLFKTTRHCLYTKRNSKDFIQKIIFRLKKIIKKNKYFKNYDDFIFFAELRILSDIDKIFKNKKFYYDYEKKVHNLFELKEYYDYET